MKRLRGIVAFDLDGTLLRRPTVCELIARSIGRLSEMQQFECDHSKRGLTAARMEMARWYKSYRRSTLCAALDGARWAPGAHEAVSDLQRFGVEVAIASVTWRFAVAKFARTLKVRHFIGTGLSQNGKVLHIWPAGKAAWFRELILKLGLSRYQAAAVGDSVSDRDLLRAASLRFFVGANAPAIPRVIHLPNADLREIAQFILQQYGR